MSLTTGLKSLVLAAAVALSGCASVLEFDDALAVAPYRIDDNGRIVIDVHVNGRGPFDFVLDSASSISAVFERMRNNMGLEPVPGKAVIIHGAVASGQFPLLEVDRLAVGDEAWADPRIVALPAKTGASASTDGLLGVDFLRHYAIGFSTRDRVVRLYPPDIVAERAYRGWSSIPLLPESIGGSEVELYFLEIEIAGQKIRAMFDLGAGFSVINWAGARSLGITRSQVREEYVLSGALESERVTATLVANRLRTAGVVWRNEELSIADFEIFETLMLTDSPAAILGAGLFTQRDFVIDFVRNRLLVRTGMDEISAPGQEAARP